MPRFYIAQDLPSTFKKNGIVECDAEIAHHIQVLRLKIGDPLTLFNGEGGEFDAELVDIQKKICTIKLTHFHQQECELPFSLHLAQGLPEGGKLDWIIEKAVELGVQKIIPLAAQRSVVKITADKVDKKLQHWQGIIQSATQQCGRHRLTSISAPLDFKKFVRDFSLSYPSYQLILFSPRATLSFATWVKEQSTQARHLACTLLIGPEGGLSDEEESLAIQNGALSLRMGNRILRTETAGMAAASILSAAWGGMA